MQKKSIKNKFCSKHSETNILFLGVLFWLSWTQVSWAPYISTVKAQDQQSPKTGSVEGLQELTSASIPETTNEDELPKNQVLDLLQGVSKKVDSFQVIEKDYLRGRFKPSQHDKFKKIPLKFSWTSNLMLREESLDAFKKMYQAAKKDGVDLVIRSATRPFFHQKSIWERKWLGQKNVSGINLAQSLIKPILKTKMILKNSAMPGVSRHHWGTEVDLNAFTNSYFKHGKGKKAYDWLQENAYKYGYCQPYSSTQIDPNRTGHSEERWHWSYFPLANQFQKSFTKNLKDKDINGFLGSEFAKKIHVIENFAAGISKDCTLHMIPETISIPSTLLGR